MNYNETKNFSTAAIRAAKDIIEDLLEGTTEMAAAFKVMADETGEPGCPLDPQLMKECDQLFLTINRLLYQQEAELKHMQCEKIATVRAENQRRAIHKRRAEREAAKEEQLSLAN